MRRWGRKLAFPSPTSGICGRDGLLLPYSSFCSWSVSRKRVKKLIEAVWWAAGWRGWQADVGCRLLPCTAPLQVSLMARMALFMTKSIDPWLEVSLLNFAERRQTGHSLLWKRIKLGGLYFGNQDNSKGCRYLAQLPN